MKIDIGCGAAKRDGCIGIDFAGSPDILCDISRDRFPFDDQSVEYVYSAHCLEHIERAQLPQVFSEITRVCADGAIIELWHPHWSHSDAYVLGHTTLLSETLYNHLGCLYREFWSACLGAQWVLQECRYGIDVQTLNDMEVAGVSLDFAVKYYREVIREIGVLIRIDRSGAPYPRTYRRSISAYEDRGQTVTPLPDAILS